MPPPPAVDVSAILNAVYRAPIEAGDSMAARVRARLALMETAGECLRLLVEAPLSALKATLQDAGGAEESAVAPDAEGD